MIKPLTVPRRESVQKNMSNTNETNPATVATAMFGIFEAAS